MFARKAAVVAAMSSVALISSAVSAREMCWSKDEIAAAQMAEFNINLMVHALQCRANEPRAMALYEAFADHQRSTLDANSLVLKAHFTKGNLEHSSGQGDEYEAAKTAVANYYAGKVLRNDQQSCAGLASITQLATQLSPEQLRDLSASMILPPEGDACPAGAAPLATTAVEAPAAALATPAPLAQAAPLDDGVPTYRTAAAEPPQPPAGETLALTAVAPDEAARPVQPAAVAAPPAPAAAPSIEALNAAVVALQSATAALQKVAAGQSEPSAKPAPSAEPATALR